jgi:hypothetical protein
VHRHPLFRVIALIMALLVSVSAPVQALAHGQAHAHLAADHDHDHDRAAVAGPSTGHHVADAVEASGDDHRHDHPRLVVIESGRDASRLRVLTNTILLVVVPSARELDTASAAAPPRRVAVGRVPTEPDRGPPPTLRAPPQR